MQFSYFLWEGGTKVLALWWDALLPEYNLIATCSIRSTSYATGWSGSFQSTRIYWFYSNLVVVLKQFLKSKESSLACFLLFLSTRFIFEIRKILQHDVSKKYAYLFATRLNYWSLLFLFCNRKSLMLFDGHQALLVT